MNNLVAFCGAAGAGKSTAADALVAEGWRVVSFARPLKAMFLQMLLQAGVDDSTAARMIHGDLKETPADVLAGRSPRHAMQTLGTEWGRDCMAEDFWTRLAVRQIREIHAAGGRVVVDDCRFPNEAAAVRDLGGSVFEVVGRGGIAGNHVSEEMEFTADLLVDNSGGPVDLAAALETVLGSLAA